MSSHLPESDKSPLRAIVDKILKAGAQQGMNAKTLAAVAGVRAETISRMKARGTGDFDMVDRLARAAGLQLNLTAVEVATKKAGENASFS
jgi:hypothetical protein